MRNESFSNFLRETRLKLGKTQTDGAEALGITQAYYGRIENNGIIPPGRLEQLAMFLQVSSEELTEKGHMSMTAAQNIAPLIRLLAQCSLESIYLDDIEFFAELQNTLDRPLTADVISSLMQLRTPATAAR